jgi:hypothetical protein
MIAESVSMGERNPVFASSKAPRASRSPQAASNEPQIKVLPVSSRRGSVTQPSNAWEVNRPSDLNKPPPNQGYESNNPGSLRRWEAQPSSRAASNEPQIKALPVSSWPGLPTPQSPNVWEVNRPSNLNKPHPKQGHGSKKPGSLRRWEAQPPSLAASNEPQVKIPPLSSRRALATPQSSNVWEVNRPSDLNKSHPNQSHGSHSPGSLRRWEAQPSSEDHWNQYAYASSSRRPSRHVNDVKDIFKRLLVSEPEEDADDNGGSKKRPSDSQGGRENDSGKHESSFSSTPKKAKAQVVSRANAAQPKLKFDEIVMGPKPEKEPFVCLCCKRHMMALSQQGRSSEHVPVCKRVAEERSVRRYCAKRHTDHFSPIREKRISREQLSALKKEAYEEALRLAEGQLSGGRTLNGREKDEFVWRECMCFLYPELIPFKFMLNPYSYEDEDIVFQLRELEGRQSRRQRPGSYLVPSTRGIIRDPDPRTWAQVAATVPSQTPATYSTAPASSMSSVFSVNDSRQHGSTAPVVNAWGTQLGYPRQHQIGMHQNMGQRRPSFNTDHRSGMRFPPAVHIAPRPRQSAAEGPRQTVDTPRTHGLMQDDSSTSRMVPVDPSLLNTDPEASLRRTGGSSGSSHVPSVPSFRSDPRTLTTDSSMVRTPIATDSVTFTTEPTEEVLPEQRGPEPLDVPEQWNTNNFQPDPMSQGGYMDPKDDGLYRFT